jgi:acyl-CoA thioesterase YciA
VTRIAWGQACLILVNQARNVYHQLRCHHRELPVSGGKPWSLASAFLISWCGTYFRLAAQPLEVSFTLFRIPTKRYLAIKAAMMPRDTNPHGTIFGGVILSYIDQAGAVGARHVIRRAGWPDRRLVTVAMKSVEFHKPVFVGDIVSYWTRVIHVGNTSISMRVSVETERDGKVHKVTQAEVTYVAIELDGCSPRPVPIRGTTEE